jgi:hypothetical protein
MSDDLDNLWAVILQELLRIHLPTYSLASVHAMPAAYENGTLVIAVIGENVHSILQSKRHHLETAVARISDSPPQIIIVQLSRWSNEINRRGGAESGIVVFGDESGISNQRYMLLGAVCIPRCLVDIFSNEVKRIRLKTGMTKELKWTRVSNQHFENYQHYVDLFFAWNRPGLLSFHCKILDSHKINYSLYAGGDSEAGFYRFFYQLLLHSIAARYSMEGYRLDVLLDFRSTGYSLDKLRSMLNSGFKKNYSDRIIPFRTVQHVDSKEHELMQITDLILGAICFRKNNQQKRLDARKAKVELSEYIFAHAGLTDELPNTPKQRKHFTVWNFRLRDPLKNAKKE